MWVMPLTFIVESVFDSIGWDLLIFTGVLQAIINSKHITATRGKIFMT
jgi:hypothetical protein